MHTVRLRYSVTMAFSYNCEWDPDKAHSNFSKHGISFEQAASVFLDPLALSIPDIEHSENEERWILLGTGQGSQLLVVVHTHFEMTTDSVVVRIISARKATTTERRQYEEFRE